MFNNRLDDHFDHIASQSRRSNFVLNLSTVAVLAIMVGVGYQLFAMHRKQEACHARGGLMVKEMFGASCVDPSTVQRVIIEER